uniref:Reverse transcriptase domain-containing protein n=1 Tax=Tanacetum cinerariifolium TaxID=118510 RepID=A0A6L2J2W3_TANCI|nr:reverse transcriptase domain-containing protein [Tanacetum cinerariifolium]
MLQAFPVSLTGAASRWLRNEPVGSILTLEVLKSKFLSKYCPPARTTKKIEEINNFQQEPDKSFFRAWERFKEILMKCVIPTKIAANAKVSIQEMVEYSQKWHNGTSRAISTETSDGLAAIQAQLNSLRTEIKKVNEKVYVAQMGREDEGDHEGKKLDKTLIDIPIFVGNFSITLGFSIINDMDVRSGVVLGMPFCKKFVSCQKIMEKFARKDEYEQIEEE